MALGELRVIKMLLPLLSTYRWALPAIVGLGVLSSLAEGLGIALFVPLLGSFGPQAASNPSSQNIIARLFEGPLDGLSADARLLALTVAILGAVTLRVLLAYANDAVFAWLEARISNRLRCGLYGVVTDVDYAFFQTHDSGRLVNAMSSESWKTTEALWVFVRMIVNGITALIYVLLLLALGWRLTLGVLFALGLISLLVRFLTRRADSLSTLATQESAALATRTLEGTRGAKLIRTYSRQEYEKSTFNRSSSEVSRLTHRLALVRASVNPVYEILAATVLMVILYTSLRDDPNSLPSLLVFVVVLYRLQPKLTALDRDRVKLMSVGGSIREVLGLIDPGNKPFQLDGTVDAAALKPEFVLRSVDFQYPQSQPLALRDVSLVIPAGRTTALVGPSGSGKSTLVDLLLRLHDPTGGDVTFGGVPLHDLQLATLRRRIAVVSQDVFLFNASVRANIGYGQAEADHRVIEEAARQAHAHDFIQQLPQGYDTTVGEQGFRLSGGQRQRLTLARAIVRNPSVLILDEATNALDAISERIIQDALDELSANRTVIVIAHRLSTVSKADNVVVLQGGRVVEVGAPAELLSRDGLFTELNRAQRMPTPR